MNKPLDQWTNADRRAYWAAALALHRERIEAGCLSPVGAIRVSGGRKEEQEQETDNES